MLNEMTKETKNRLTKTIAYAFPSSTHAKEFGSHGYYVEEVLSNVEGSDQCNIAPHQSAYAGDVFQDIRDADLWSLFKECDGIPNLDMHWIIDQFAKGKSKC
jgi:hypothetical protein